MSTLTRTATQAHRRRRLLRPGWLLAVLFLGFPAWWLLGLAFFIWPIVSAFILLELLKRKRVVVPRGFGLWLLFLMWMVGSSLMLDEPNRWIIFLYRLSLYASATLLFIYVYNHSEQLLPAERVLQVLAGFWAIVVAGGILGLLLPDVSFRSPVEMIMPPQLLSNEWVRDLVHPRFAEVSMFLGYRVPRPSAPFPYTNEWGSTIAVLTPLAIAFAQQRRSALRSRLVTGFLMASVIPIILSLNRGLWLSLGLGLAYGILRLTLRLKGRALAVLLFAVVAIAFVLNSPLKGFVEDRLATPHSNAGRLELYEETTEGVLESPLLGYGAPRPSSRPFLPSVGSHGQFWMVIYSHGIPAAVLFVGWLVYAFWRSRRGHSLAQLWTHVAILTAVIMLPYYGMLHAPIHIVMIAAALAWREGPWVPMAGSNAVRALNLERDRLDSPARLTS